MTPLPPLKTDLRGAASRLRDKTAPERPRGGPLEENRAGGAGAVAEFIPAPLVSVGNVAGVTASLSGATKLCPLSRPRERRHEPHAASQSRFSCSPAMFHIRTLCEWRSFVGSPVVNGSRSRLRPCGLSSTAIRTAPPLGVGALSPSQSAVHRRPAACPAAGWNDRIIRWVAATTNGPLSASCRSFV